MPRTARITPGGWIFHIVNRGNRRAKIFDRASDYRAFLKVLGAASERHPTAILAYCVMPNHWHLVVRPVGDSDLPRFMHYLTLTHVRRLQRQRGLEGTGHIYQGRYRSFPVQSNRYLLTVIRYVERNPVAAGLVESVRQWPWSSFRFRGDGDGAAEVRLEAPPIDLPERWCEFVDRPLTETERARVARSLQRGQPFGAAAWRRSAADALGLRSTLRTPGRPRK